MNSNRSSKPTITLAINQFEVNASLYTPNRCGGWSGKFTTELEVTSNRLDSSGFVIEANYLKQFIRDYFSKSTYIASCEQLASCITALVHGLIKKENLLAIRVKVYSPTGHIIMHWNAGDKLPGLLNCFI